VYIYHPYLLYHRSFTSIPKDLTKTTHYYEIETNKTNCK
jgi:hypothetical protein